MVNKATKKLKDFPKSWSIYGVQGNYVLLRSITHDLALFEVQPTFTVTKANDRGGRPTMAPTNVRSAQRILQVSGIPTLLEAVCSKNSRLVAYYNLKYDFSTAIKTVLLDRIIQEHLIGLRNIANMADYGRGPLDLFANPPDYLREPMDLDDESPRPLEEDEEEFDDDEDDTIDEGVEEGRG